MLRFVHSLRFQLPAVLLGLFVIMLGLWVLLFRELSSITGKTQALNLSSEISDRVTEWSNHVATAARERTKFMTLSKEGYLEGFLIAAQDFEANYRSISDLKKDSHADSYSQLKEYYDLNREYSTRAQAYAWEWRNIEKLRVHLRENWAKPLPPAYQEVSVAVKSPKTAKASGKKAAQAQARKGKATRKIPNPQFAAAVKARQSAEQNLNALLKRKRLHDSTAADAFKAIEGRLREGLQAVQANMRQERMDKQRSLQATIDRAKQRLLYSLVLLTLMVAYVAYILQWKILEPLSHLENGAIQIGRGYLGFRVDVNSQSEIGDLAKVFNTMSDQLSHHRDSELRLKRLDAIQQVVRSVNHEINNPLMIISGNAEYLLTVLDSQDPAVKEKLNTIVSEVRRIFHVTQQLKEIKDLVTSNYTSDEDQMIDIARSSQVIRRAW
jgi:HAMP domain-containing protein